MKLDNKTTDNRKINKWAFWPAIVILIIFILSGVIWTEEVGAVMTKLLYGMADYFGAYINLLSLVFIFLAVVFLIGRYGDVILVCDVHLFRYWHRSSVLGNGRADLPFHDNTRSHGGGRKPQGGHLCSGPGYVGLEFCPVLHVCHLRGSLCNHLLQP